MSPTPDFIVVGAGPAGLAAAFGLQQQGHTVRVLESSARAGSTMSVVRRDGFLLDTGAIFLPSTYAHLMGIVADLGIDDELVESQFVFGLGARGGVHHLDGNRPVSALRDFGGLSTSGKVKALALAPEVLRSRLATPDRIEEAARFDGESVEAWSRRAVPAEVRDSLVSAIVRGGLRRRAPRGLPGGVPGHPGTVHRRQIAGLSRRHGALPRPAGP